MLYEQIKLKIEQKIIILGFYLSKNQVYRLKHKLRNDLSIILKNKLKTKSENYSVICLRL